MESSKLILCVTSTLILGFAAFSYFIYKNRKKEPFHYLSIKIVSNEADCVKVVHELRRRCLSHNAVGFDCEWITRNGSRKPVALLQLSTFDGYCGLFRLNLLQSIPESLKDLLADKTVYKLGVVPYHDSQYIYNDYSTIVKSCLDIRHLAILCGYKAEGLASLSKAVLGIMLDKSWRIRCSDWEAERLSDKQVKYAAADAHVAIKIFDKVVNNLRNESIWTSVNKDNNDFWNNINRLCMQFTDRRYTSHSDANLLLKDPSQNKEGKKTKKSLPKKKYEPATRSKPLYHNCFLQAPDGEILCTCDNNKAMWYVQNHLATVLEEKPLTVRLHFEPAGRSVGDSGRYYQLTKENKCVVCGSYNTYIRKNVVPREYRKAFPEVMKDHSSHDVLLLCVPCHQRSNMSDARVKDRLVGLCSAPMISKNFSKFIEDPAVRKVRSAARALLNPAHKLPPARCKELENILLEHFPEHSEITEELLQHAANLTIAFENAEYASHGQKVVDYFMAQDGGLLRLEEMWREHFLNTMQPEHMPSLWSVKHTEERLLLRMKEGRLSEQDIKLLGLAEKI